MKFVVFVVLGFRLTTPTWAAESGDSTVYYYFQDIASKLKLSPPHPKPGEYEIRIWQKQGLRYGKAQRVYVLRKTKKRVRVLKYIMNSNEQGFQSAERLKPTVRITPIFWNRLLSNNMLTLPDQSVVFKRLDAEPEPPKDTVKAGMQADGSFTIKGYRTRRRRTLISDGDGYSFELFTTGGYRAYHYGNPHAYLMDQPQSEELRNVVNILNDLSLVFRSDKLGRGQAKAINTN